jgi:hypothetical protein
MKLSQAHRCRPQAKGGAKGGWCGIVKASANGIQNLWLAKNTFPRPAYAVPYMPAKIRALSYVTVFFLGLGALYCPDISEFYLKRFLSVEYNPRTRERQTGGR